MENDQHRANAVQSVNQNNKDQCQLEFDEKSMPRVAATPQHVPPRKGKASKETRPKKISNMFDEFNLFAFDDEEDENDMGIMNLKKDRAAAQKPKVKIKRQKKKSRKITLVKMPDQDQAASAGNQQNTDNFTLKMKELGIDWNKLEDGAEIDLDQERQTIHLGNECLIELNQE